MKKFISIVMALVMMMLVAVPAFAAELNEKPSQNGNVTIVTDTKDADGNDAEKYTVTIPADTTIPWGQEVTAVDYSVTSQLKRNHRVAVEVTGSGSMKTVDAVYAIDYALDGAAEYTTTQPTIVTPDAQSLDVVIAADEWAGAVVEEYSDILTYAAEIVTVA